MRRVFGAKAVVAALVGVAWWGCACALGDSPGDAASGVDASQTPVHVRKDTPPSDEAAEVGRTANPAVESTPEENSRTTPPDGTFRDWLGSDSPTEGDAIDGPNWWAMAAWLAFIVALIYVLAVVVRKVAPGSARMFSSRSVLVRGRTFIAPKQSLVLVEVGKRILVLGVTQQTITLVSEITDPDEVSSIKQAAASEENRSISSGFRDIFRRATRETRQTTEQATQGSLAGVKDDLDELLRRTQAWRDRHGGTT